MVNVQSATSAAPFSGAVEPRPVEAPQIQSTPTAAAPSTGDVDIQVSTQSLAVSAPPAAAPAADAFANAGSRQYEVFSSYLAGSGAQSGMSPAQIQSTQSLIRDVTSTMDAIAPGNRPMLSETAPSRSAAELALTSSVAALDHIGASLPKEMQGGFQELIGQYKAHNEQVVRNYQSIHDIRDTTIANAGPPLPAYAEGKERVESSEIMRKLGSIAHSEVDRQEVTKAYAAIFDAARKNDTDVATMFRKLKTAFVTYASGGSQDAAVREVLSERNTPALDQMHSYWDKLLSKKSEA